MTCLLVVISAFFGWNIQNVTFDFEFEKFFPNNHPDSKAYANHVKQFGYDNDYLHVIIERKNGIFDKEFLPLAGAFEKSLNGIEDVENVYSPLSLQHVVKSPTGLVIFPLIHTENPTDYQLNQDSARVFGNPLYRSAFSKTGAAMSIYIHHAHFADQERGERLLKAIRDHARKFGITNLRLVGKLSAVGVFISYIQNDFGKFLVGSLILSFGLLLLIFRNLKSALIPFLISLLSLVWLFGLMGFLGIRINLLSSLLPPILFFVSMSDAVHLMNALKKSGGASNSEKIKEALRVVWIPTLLTSVTTAIGFLSLIWINTEPVQMLGLFAAIGVLFAFIITFTFGLLVASVTSYSSKNRIIEIPTFWVSLLIKRKWKIVLLSLGILIALIPGISQLKINSFLLDDLPEDSQVRLDFEYADEELGGSKPYEIRVEVADSSLTIWDKEVMDEIVKIEEYLLHKYPISKVQSPVTIIKYLNMAGNGGLNENYTYPDKEKIYQRTLRLKDRIDPKRLDKLVTEDGKAGRLIGFFPELGSYETDQRNQKLINYLDENIDKEKINYRITGTTYLIDKSHELLSVNLLKGLLTAIGIIGVILGLYFKSWKLLIISLIPNIIPLVMVAGILGWLGISLKMTTSIIFTIAFGIAVDDTIHMMSFYLKNPEPDPIRRMEITFRHAGSAMLITSIIMTAGFSLYLLSTFGATFYMGLFVSLSLLIAMVVDLSVLPLLLITFRKNATKRESNT
ncbi:MAG: efflux RND transporter permease subunit [Ekhidna sp.]|uniref:efflux RND transporter permease subunit n=1 Tax=Ekhidna sp. TaxID=2608089 RepID=UPI0032EFE28D